MTKTKWYKDKWGWIGALPGLFYLTLIGYGFFIVGGEGRMIIGFLPYALFGTIIGFLIGKGIHKLFFKFKWVKH